MDKLTLLLGVILTISIINFVSAELTNYSSDCSDTDSGLNYYIKGTANYNNFDYKDSCVISPAVVNEGQPNEYHLEVGDLQEYACYYPEGKERCYATACPFIKYHCPYGCEDGACLSSSDNVPSCMYNPIKGYSWYDNNGAVKFNVSCLGCSPICDKVGTEEEGWYSSCDNSLIKLDTCGLREGEQDCSDTDGKDYFVRGFTSYQGSKTIEICTYADGPTTGEEGDRVIESYCENEIKKTETYKCPSGKCEEGACLKCYDTDGRDYYTRGTNKFDGSSTIEICVGDDGKPTTGEEGTSVTESWCEDNEKNTEIHSCPNGCKEGACIKVVPVKEPIEIPEDVEEEEEVFVCQGCPLDKKCYPFGYRKDGRYCSDNQEFNEQLKTKESCENNFECKSNVCVDGECISGGLLRKILNWFRKLFGGE